MPTLSDPVWLIHLMATAGMAGVLGLWAVAVQVPLHRRLAAGFGAGAHRSLVRGNWARTAAWPARTGSVGWLTL